MMNIIKNNLTKLTKPNLVRLFGKKSRGAITPRVIKDPRFTRTGYHKMKKSRPKQYDLEGVENAHLYYDHKVDGPLRHKEWKKRRNLRRKEIPIEEEDYDLIVEDLVNHNLLTRGSYKLILRIRQLETLHPTRINEWQQVVNYVINQALGGHFVQYKLRTIAPIMVFAAKYATLPPQRFKNVAFYVMGLIRNSEYQEALYEGANQRKIVAIIRGLQALYRKGLDSFPQTVEVYNGVMASIFESCLKSGQFEAFERGMFLTILDITTKSSKVQILGDEVKEMLQNCMKGKIGEMDTFARILSIDSKFKVLEERDTKRIVNQSLGLFAGKKKLNNFVTYRQFLVILKAIENYEEYNNDKAVLSKIPRIFNNFNQLFLKETNLNDLFILYSYMEKSGLTGDVFDAVKEEIAQKFSIDSREIEHFANYVIYSDKEGGEIDEIFVESFMNLLREDENKIDSELMTQVDQILAQSNVEEFDELRNEIVLKLNQY